MSSPQIENAIPVHTVSDLERSIEFYQTMQGLEVEWNAGQNYSVSRDGNNIVLRAADDPSPSTV